MDLIPDKLQADISETLATFRRLAASVIRGLVGMAQAKKSAAKRKRKRSK